MVLSNYLDCSVGDNKEFAVATISDVTVYIDHANTSSDDTATAKYFDQDFSDLGAQEDAARALFIRADQTIQIVGMNGTTFTDPITIVADKGHRETFERPWIRYLVLRTTVVNTNIKIRVK